MDNSTYIVTKNIRLDDLEKMIKNKVLTNKLINSLQSVELKIKNSRVSVVSFPNGIVDENLFKLVLKLIDYKGSEISKPEVVLVHNDLVKETTVEFIKININSNEVIKHYKLDSGPLHTILKLNAAKQITKSWWQFWK